MTFCPECGKPVAPKAKFCRNCGASQLDDALAGAVPVEAPVAPTVAAPVPAPLPSPSPAPAIPVQPPQAPVAAPPVTTSLCGACGSPLSPSEKFCGVCGARAGQVAAPASVPPAPAMPVYTPVSTPVAVPIPPPVPVLVPVMSQSSGGARTCNSSGAPVSDTTKFCGVCGAPVGASFRAAPVTPTAPAVIAAPVAAPGGEQVMGVIGNARKMKMRGASWDTYALVVTDRRLIMARITADMLNAAYKEAAERMGFLGQVAHQMSVAFQYCQRYETLPPEFALEETKGNRAIENVQITAVDMKDKPTHQDSMEYHEFIMTVKSPEGKFEFHIGEDDRFVTILKTAYGEKVHMPFGYFRVGGARIKLF